MKKLIILILLIFLMGCVYAQDSIEINDVEFYIPSQYQGGYISEDYYRLDNEFLIECVNDNVPDAIGLWASENEYCKDLNIDGHPVRHYYQYNQYVHDNQSHLYFASDESIYEIAWTGNQITKDIKNLIKNAPKSKISDDEFYYALDKSIEIYKQQKIDKLNQDSEYNYHEAKYQSHNPDTHDDRKFKEILLTYYR